MYIPPDFLIISCPEEFLICRELKPKKQLSAISYQPSALSYFLYKSIWAGYFTILVCPAHLLKQIGIFLDSFIVLLLK